MSTATLNVWITNLGDFGTIANDIGSGIPYAWSVAVMHCDGRVLNWSEGRYRLHHDDNWIPIPRHTPSGGVGAGWWYEMIPTRDGHVEIEVPPGSYVVVGSMHTWFVNGILYGNWGTDRAIVQAPSGQDVCAMLYASSFQPCCLMLSIISELLVKNKVVPQPVGDTARRAIQALYKAEALSPFEKGYVEVLRRAYAQMDKPSPLEPKKRQTRRA